MSRAWRHPELGAFKLEDDWWKGTCRLPAFKAFTWESSLAKSAGKYDLQFEVKKGREPSAAAVKLALRVIANEAKLPGLVTSALWDEFNGLGPKSEMWWYGELEGVAENFGYDKRPAPASPKDLLPAMNFNGVLIRESLYSHKKPIAELTFSAVFEEEHGVGILTNGATILGAGYVCQASTYEMQARSAQPGGEQPVEEEPRPTLAWLAELREAQARIQKIEKEVLAKFGSQDKKKKRWEKLFPSPREGTPVERDISFLCGDWKYDARESARVLKVVEKIKINMAEAQKAHGRNLYRISPKALMYLVEDYRISGVRRQGNRVALDVRSKKGLAGTWEYWCDGKVLVSDAGLAYRRTE
jgi:hypothetical protein